MSIMTCPRCGGSGKVLEGDPNSTAGQHQVTCPSCGGRGCVTDTSESSGINLKVGISPKLIVKRKPERIQRILAAIRSIWETNPDWRLGQLLINAIPEMEGSLFQIEDTVAEKRLDEFDSKLGDIDKLLKAMSG